MIQTVGVKFTGDTRLIHRHDLSQAKITRPHSHRVLSATVASAPDNAWDVKNMEIGADLSEEYGTVPKKAPPPRRTGVVLHPTSFPGPYGMGEIGSEAKSFIDWLVQADMQVWQVLPLVPPGRPIPGVREDYWSPYSGQDANAGSHLLISLNGLVEMGLLDSTDLPPQCLPAGDVDWDYVVEKKEPALFQAADKLASGSADKHWVDAFAAWRAEPDTQCWLEDTALFNVINDQDHLRGMDWWNWPVELRDRNEAALAEVLSTKKDEIDRYCALQFLFDHQWCQVKKYASEKGVKILGDMPIYVGGHSADVWANRQLFTLNEEGLSALVSGVPPDAFSEDGQLWGSPLYDWEAHAAEDFGWWTRRMQRAQRLYHETRIDHFRGLAGYWAVDAASDTAKSGSWKVGPGIALFDALKKNLGYITIIAEDLGVITPDVVELREAIQAPGMLVLQFAFDGDGLNLHRPHNHYANSIVYPGTHDNDTSVGWFQSASPEAKDTFIQYSGMSDESEVAWHMIRLAMSSVADTCIICFQDILSLDGSCRMNTPGVADGNWVWRCQGFGGLETETAKLQEMCKTFARLPSSKME